MMKGGPPESMQPRTRRNRGNKEKTQNPKQNKIRDFPSRQQRCQQHFTFRMATKIWVWFLLDFWNEHQLPQNEFHLGSFEFHFVKVKLKIQKVTRQC